jgi:hypothetical protein
MLMTEEDEEDQRKRVMKIKRTLLIEKGLSAVLIKDRTSKLYKMEWDRKRKHSLKFDSTV